jgi:hypothetical protein
VIRFRFDALGVRQFDRALSRFADSVDDWRPVFDKIHQDFLVIEKEQFESGGSRGGRAWAGYESEPVYAARKAGITGLGDVASRLCRWYPDSKEWLYPSLTDRNHPLHFWRESPLTLEMGTRVPHAQDVHSGGKFQKWDKIMTPPRALIALTDLDRKRWHHWLHLFSFKKQRESTR